ncbi:MAG: isocitrate lyase/PEP mutase family protein [Arenicellales bacterium]|jgi:2-methylisocitrate lyase-like PEP mutase family enzyme|nr:isocitrate lyase/PEP mutase family protein [Arenicellales bacterium]
MNAKKRKEFANRLRQGEYMTLPGVFDLISARIADRMAFPGLYMTGYGVVASSLGLPDAGLASYSEMVDSVAKIAQGTITPLIADGDTGYGGLLNVEHTVRGYERAGAVAIQLEDQEFPKKCGHTPDRRVIPIEDMVAKIKVAVASRESDDFLVIGRTDARSQHGLAEAIRRGQAIAQAGADVVFVEAPETIEEMTQICHQIDRPLIANMVEGGSTPVLSAQQLQEIGYQMAIFPGTAFLAAGKAVESVYMHLKETGSSPGLETPLYDFTRFSKMMGFDKVWAFEKKWFDQ